MNMEMQFNQSQRQRLQIKQIQTQQIEYTLDDFLNLWQNQANNYPELVTDLGTYFSPDKSKDLKKRLVDYLYEEIKYLKDHHSQNNYMSLVLTFQFTAPLLGLMNNNDPSCAVNQAFDRFKHVLESTYKLPDAPRVKFDLNEHSEEDFENQFISEEEAINAYIKELDEEFRGKRNVKENVCSRLTKEGFEAVRKWTSEKNKKTSSGYVLLSEAFGRSIVIPSFFAFKDNKLITFYKESTNNIKYYIEVPKKIME